MYAIIGADNCFSGKNDNQFETEIEALCSLEFLQEIYPGELDEAYVTEAISFTMANT